MRARKPRKKMHPRLVFAIRAFLSVIGLVFLFQLARGLVLGDIQVLIESSQGRAALNRGMTVHLESWLEQVLGAFLYGCGAILFLLGGLRPRTYLEFPRAVGAVALCWIVSYAVLIVVYWY